MKYIRFLYVVISASPQCHRLETTDFPYLIKFVPIEFHMYVSILAGFAAKGSITGDPEGVLVRNLSVIHHHSLSACPNRLDQLLRVISVGCQFLRQQAKYFLINMS